MSRAKQPAVHNGIDSDISSPPNSPRLAPVKARMKNRNANASASNNVRALPLQPSVIANTPKKRPHEGDDQKDAPKPKKTRKNDNKPLEPLRTVPKRAVARKPVIISKASEPPVPPKPKMKKEPQPLWTRVAPGASRKEIEDRIAIREFFLRFSEALNVKRPLLEALEDFAWMERDVAVGCLVALLDALRLDRPADTRKPYAATLKDIKSKGASYGNILFALSGLNVKVQWHLPYTPFKQPLGSMKDDPAALLPAILALMDLTCSTKAIRKAIEEGTKATTNIKKEFFSKRKAEDERWAAVRKPLQDEKKVGGPGFNLEKWKAKFEKAKAEHDKIVTANLHAYHKANDLTQPRYITYTDSDGRTYYIFSTSPRQRPPARNQRKDFAKWTWFIAVWGKRPLSAQRVDEEGEEEDTEFTSRGKEAKIKETENEIKQVKVAKTVTKPKSKLKKGVVEDTESEKSDSELSDLSDSDSEHDSDEDPLNINASPIRLARFEGEELDKNYGWWGFGEVAECKLLVEWLKYKAGVSEDKEKQQITDEAEDADGGGSPLEGFCKAITKFTDMLQWADDITAPK